MLNHFRRLRLLMSPFSFTQTMIDQTVSIKLLWVTCEAASVSRTSSRSSVELRKHHRQIFDRPTNADVYSSGRFRQTRNHPLDSNQRWIGIRANRTPHDPGHCSRCASSRISKCRLPRQTILHLVIRWLDTRTHIVIIKLSRPGSDRIFYSVHSRILPGCDGIITWSSPYIKSESVSDISGFAEIPFSQFRPGQTRLRFEQTACNASTVDGQGNSLRRPRRAGSGQNPRHVQCRRDGGFRSPSSDDHARDFLA